jgi:MATE family multidrug resistance protein
LPGLVDLALMGHLGSEVYIGATFLVSAPVFYFLNPVLGNHALWLGVVLFMLARGAFQTFLYKNAILKPLN